MPIRFRPTSAGAKSATITIFSDDAAGPHVVHVHGLGRLPRLSLITADMGNFGRVCVGSFADEPLILNNSGHCPVSILGITSSSGEFHPPTVLAFPLRIAAGDSLPVPIRFAPTIYGSASSDITVTSTDPASPHVINVQGFAPSPRIFVRGSLCFGGVEACCCADRTTTICNLGSCALHVTGVKFKHESKHWKLVDNPFPATLPPGSCQSVVVRHKANERCPKPNRLIIKSDDPRDCTYGSPSGVGVASLAAGRSGRWPLPAITVG